MPNTTERSIFTVSQLNRRAKQLLETHLPLIWVSGEISNLAKPSSGHWYFSLKDNQAQVRCAMFRQVNTRVKSHIASGQEVLIRARVSLYEGRGEYQLIAEHIEPAGAGALQQQFEALKARLSSEGLFDDDNKQALPEFPQHIGLITSPTGAAVHDIISVLKRRYPIAQVTIFPVSVQGENSVPDMIHALDKVQKFKQCDVVIIGRGGGSLEDLWAFNNEALVRAIAAFSQPIVSAVGHEVDVTLCDYVADKRAATPSAAAELVSPDIDEWLQTLDHYQSTLYQRTARLLASSQQKLSALKARLRHPRETLQLQYSYLIQLQQKLSHNIQHRLNLKRNQLQTVTAGITRYKHQQVIKQHLQSISNLKLRLIQSQQRVMNTSAHNLSHQVATLHAVSPLAVLSRGYSIAKRADGSVIKYASEISKGEKIQTALHSGTIISTVESTTADT